MPIRTIGLVGAARTGGSVAWPHRGRRHGSTHVRTAITHLWLRAAVGVAISVAFAVATFARVDIDSLSEAWRSVGIAMLGLAVAISVTEVALRALRWRILLSPIVPVSYGTALGLLTIGHFANALLPARLGDLARALASAYVLRVSRATTLGTIAVERVADAGLLSLAVALGALAGFAELAPTALVLAAAGAAVAAAAVAVTMVLRRRAVAESRIGAIVRRYGGRFAAGATALRRPASLVALLLLTLMSFTLTVAILLVVATAVGMPLQVWQAALAISAMTLATAIPAGPASIGTYEFAGVTILSAMGYPMEQSLLAAGLVHLAVVLPPALTGLVSTWIMGVRLPSLLGATPARRVGHEAA